MQGNRPESSGILTNPVGGKRLLTRVTRGKPIRRSYPKKTYGECTQSTGFLYPLVKMVLRLLTETYFN